ncbi:MAG: glycerophosphoryl diester phosphodiesterase membrane domain-containing protein [Lachnospiraceae bacterium]|nr:glycerophosphoryl diester phosphodiesterase membrane domain-containing protein [Lachnospiraceae bacterium]
MGIIRRKKTLIPEEQRQISFGRLTFQSIPEILRFQFITKIILFCVAFAANTLAAVILASGNLNAVTTANFKELFLNWRVLPIFLLTAGVILIYLDFSIFAQIVFCSDVLTGKQVRYRTILKEGTLSIKKILTLSGLPIIFYTLIAVPLVGVGFSLSLTENLQIPDFVMHVIRSNRLYMTAYVLALIVIAVIGFLHIFTIHGVVLDDLSPREARKQSTALIRTHWRGYLKRLLYWIVFVAAGILLIALLVTVIYFVLTIAAGVVDVPENYALSIDKLGSGEMTALDRAVVRSRAMTIFASLLGALLVSVYVFVMSSCSMLIFTQAYLHFTGRAGKSYPGRPERRGFSLNVLGAAAAVAGSLGLSFLLAFSLDQVFMDRTYPVIAAHRAGGVLASENSLEGIEAAISHGIGASEIDVQRTKDGRYIINHDNTFKRVAGDGRAAQDMTFDEVMQLRIPDTTGSGRELTVATIEEMLDAVRGRHKLFIELKGVTADRRMVDDLVRIIREKDCVEDVALISLNYDPIRYAAETYPEFETAITLFAAYGDITKLPGTMLLLSKEMATSDRIEAVHRAGKKVMVWTVDDEAGITDFLDGEADYILTDEVDLALQIRDKLDARTDLQRITEMIGGR